jgi:antitoxin ParD1/3/4
MDVSFEHMAETPMSTTSLHISLPEALKEFALKRVEEGAFSNPSDYVRALIRADRERQEKLVALRRDVQKGLDELDRGEGIPAEEVFERLRQRHAAGS